MVEFQIELLLLREHFPPSKSSVLVRVVGWPSATSPATTTWAWRRILFGSVTSFLLAFFDVNPVPVVSATGCRQVVPNIFAYRALEVLDTPLLVGRQLNVITTGSTESTASHVVGIAPDACLDCASYADSRRGEAALHGSRLLLHFMVTHTYHVLFVGGGVCFFHYL